MFTCSHHLKVHNRGLKAYQQLSNNWQHITIIGHSMLYQEIGISRCFPDCLISFGTWRLHVVWSANVCRISWMGEVMGPWHINSWQPRTWAQECRGRCTRMVRGRRCWKAVAGTPPLSPLPAQVPAPWSLPASFRSGSSSCFHLQTTNYYIYSTYKISSSKFSFDGLNRFSISF